MVLSKRVHDPFAQLEQDEVDLAQVAQHGHKQRTDQAKDRVWPAEGGRRVLSAPLLATRL